MTTIAGPVTQAGTIVGTINYMSPEQLEAKPVDARSDIFAFGLVLYELITGRRAFDGTSTSSVIAAILKDQPPPIRQLCPDDSERCRSTSSRPAWRRIPTSDGSRHARLNTRSSG